MRAQSGERHGVYAHVHAHKVPAWHEETYSRACQLNQRKKSGDAHLVGLVDFVFGSDACVSDEVECPALERFVGLLRRDDKY